MSHSRRGFTLIELLVVMLIVGILAAFAIPQYTSTMEHSKAMGAVGLVNMVGAANKMYALNNLIYTKGIIKNGTTCLVGTWLANYPENLVACKYLAAQNWDTNPYQAASVDPTSGGCPFGGVGGGGGGGGSKLLACVKRQNGSGIYANWGYTMADDGTITTVGGAPAVGGAVEGGLPIPRPGATR